MASARGGAVRPIGQLHYYLSFILSLLGGAFAALGNAHASAWNRDPGDALVIARFEQFDIDALSAIEDFRRRDISVYGEYGWRPNIMIGGKVVYGVSDFVNDELPVTVSGFSEVEFFAQYQVIRKGTQAIAARAAIIQPASIEAGVLPELAGDGTDFDFAALYGRSLPFPVGDAYVSSEFGYRTRTGAGADQLRADITFGANLSWRWLALLDVQSRRSLGPTEFGTPNFDVVRLQPSVRWKPTRRYGIQAGAFFDVAGRNLTSGRSVFISIWANF